MEISWKETAARLVAESLSSWTGDSSQSGGVLTCAGQCPRCDHVTVAEVQPHQVIVLADANTDEDPFTGVPAFFLCQCDTVHAEGKRGCGAYWVACPLRRAVGQRYGFVPVEQPDVTAAAKLVADESAVARLGLRKLAESWIPGIAAVVGLLGLAGVILSKDAVEGLSIDWRITAYALVASAVLLAAAATALAYRAAFGWPTEITIQTDDDLIAVAQRIKGRDLQIARGIRVAVGCSFGSLAALLIALAVFWLQPSTAESVKVSYPGVDSLCGKFVKVEGEQLVLQVSDGPVTKEQQVPLDAVSTLEIVKTCGG